MGDEELSKKLEDISERNRTKMEDDEYNKRVKRFNWIFFGVIIAFFVFLYFMSRPATSPYPPTDNQTNVTNVIQVTIPEEQFVCMQMKFFNWDNVTYGDTIYYRIGNGCFSITGL